MASNPKETSRRAKSTPSRRRPAKGPARRTPQVIHNLPVSGNDEAQRRRRLVAELCKVIGAELDGAPPPQNGPPRRLDLSPRVRQTLDALLKGDQEKEIASAMGVSRHTVHVYVKKLYRKFNVSSRGELLARFVRGR